MPSGSNRVLASTTIFTNNIVYGAENEYSCFYAPDWNNYGAFMYITGSATSANIYLKSISVYDRAYVVGVY